MDAIRVVIHFEDVKDLRVSSYAGRRSVAVVTYDQIAVLDEASLRAALRKLEGDGGPRLTTTRAGGPVVERELVGAAMMREREVRP